MQSYNLNNITMIWTTHYSYRSANESKYKFNVHRLVNALFICFLKMTYNQIIYEYELLQSIWQWFERPIAPIDPPMNQSINFMHTALYTHYLFESLIWNIPKLK